MIELLTIRSLNFLVRSGPVAMSAELLDFQPFGCVPAILLSGVSRDTRRALGGVGPAFSALKSDHDPDALVFGHKGRCAADAKRSEELRSYRAASHDLTPSFTCFVRSLAASS